MDLTRSIDIYCERVGPAFWAEPVNAITNLAFLTAAIWAWRLARRRGVADYEIAILAVLAAAVGVASFLFHTYAEIWAATADAGSIVIFILVYAFIAIRRMFGASAMASLLIIAAFVAARAALIHIWPDDPAWRLPYWNGSLGYAPALVAMLMFGGALALTGRTGARTMLLAVGALAASLTFRTLDPEICDAFPLGTHFLWHVLNGLVFALVLHALVQGIAAANPARRAAS